MEGLAGELEGLHLPILTTDAARTRDEHEEFVKRALRGAGSSSGTARARQD